MVAHDGHVGQLLDLLDGLKIADNTIVIWSTDNGAEVFIWPDGGMTPFHAEKATTREGGFRVPAVVRWPGRIPAGKVVNGIVSHITRLRFRAVLMTASAFVLGMVPLVIASGAGSVSRQSIGQASFRGMLAALP
jgi:membrane-anchored protein YejM (alkaline phosphatase superfamily)